MLKLNIGCGEDIIDGYENIDINPVNDKVKLGNFERLNYTDNSIDEIRAINVIQYIKTQSIVAVLEQWKQKLQENGELYIQSNDINLIGIEAGMGNLELPDLLPMLYDERQTSIWNLNTIESILIDHLHMNIIDKGYSGLTFFIRVSK